MVYFTVVSNHGSYRTTSHKFKLVFLHRTTVVAVDEDVISKTCFNMFSFSDLLNMTQDYDFLVDVIDLLTSMGEEKEYAKEEKIVKMIVLKLTSKNLIMRCALFGDYVNQVNHFLVSGYVEQLVVVIQLAKNRNSLNCQVGLQNVMYAIQMLFNPDLSEVVEFRRSMIEQGVKGTQPLFIANEGKVVSLKDNFMRLTRRRTIKELQDNNEDIYPQNGAYYCDFCVKHITNVTPRFKIKITLEDHSGEGIFVLFDREASYLFKKSCADLFIEVQKNASLIYEDTYPPIFQALIRKNLLLKVDIKGVGLDKFFGIFRVRRVCDDPTIITMFELSDYDADDESTLKKVTYTYKDTDIKNESSSTSIKSDNVAVEPSGILSKSPVLIDFLAEKQRDVYGGIEVVALINGENEKVEKTPKNDTFRDDFSSELDILLSSPVKKTQEVFSQVLNACFHYREKVIREDHVVTSKGKRNLNPQFDEAANGLHQ
ncbi:uncharacterized protein LOC130948856 [Arachis stenosperma]|uniref:uncharacterized protein LOC130948856 n=1 Tax=Arachis stenosperma TaxID=217475 RepID=UPI0025AC366F|nr:uncharacterized protein LOC130948856 [Arachis stenosperma]